VLDKLMFVCAVGVVILAVVMVLDANYLAAGANAFLAAWVGVFPPIYRGAFNRGYVAGHAQALTVFLDLARDNNDVSSVDLQRAARHESARLWREYEAVE